MSDLTQHIYSPNLISVCVNDRCEGDIAGVIWDFYHEEPHPFGRAMELLRYADELFDEMNFPQQGNRFRTFDGAEKLPRRRREVFHKDKVRTMENLEEKKGNLGTFIVQVKYRQNSTWQGQVIWAEENKKVYFRSALELLRLIDDATAAGSAQEPDLGAEWEETEL